MFTIVKVDDFGDVGEFQKTKQYLPNLVHEGYTTPDCVNGTQ